MRCVTDRVGNPKSIGRAHIDLGDKTIVIFLAIDTSSVAIRKFV